TQEYREQKHSKFLHRIPDQAGLYTGSLTWDQNRLLVGAILPCLAVSCWPTAAAEKYCAPGGLERLLKKSFRGTAGASAPAVPGLAYPLALPKVQPLWNRSSRSHGENVISSDDQFNFAPLSPTSNLIHDWPCSGTRADHQATAFPPIRIQPEKARPVSIAWWRGRVVLRARLQNLNEVVTIGWTGHHVHRRRYCDPPHCNAMLARARMGHVLQHSRTHQTGNNELRRTPPSRSAAGSQTCCDSCGGRRGCPDSSRWRAESWDCHSSADWQQIGRASC